MDAPIIDFFAADFDFEKAQAQVWAYQSHQNRILQEYLALLGGSESPVFLPIAAFKSHRVQTGDWQPQAVFESSGTTGHIPSRHFVKDLDLYKEVALAGFFQFYPPKKYKILALLPSYLERKTASLVRMVTDWIDAFGTPQSGFYLHNHRELAEAIAQSEGENILLIGVAFALLDFATELDFPLPAGTIVIETGGMKNRRREMTRASMHALLIEKFGITEIHSEYGMTELLSQAYSLGAGKFRCPPWMRVEIADIHLPSRRLGIGHVGRIHIVDLANIHSCSFIATDDLGRVGEDGTFEVLGRIDDSELRGCNALYE